MLTADTTPTAKPNNDNSQSAIDLHFAAPIVSSRARKHTKRRPHDFTVARVLIGTALDAEDWKRQTVHRRLLCLEQFCGFGNCIVECLKQQEDCGLRFRRWRSGVK